ncbi:MAG: hypothetical protein K8L99_23085 [Anaerolineae bacterium]|nr:hypothetical protein [Anaerolineae bacterium]
MIVALLLVILLVILIMSFQGKGRVPWAGKLRRLHAGSAHRGEWMAPNAVLERVRDDYLEAVDWLHNSMMLDRAQRWVVAPIYLEGGYLKRFQRIVNYYQSTDKMQAYGVLRSAHEVSVRHFSEDGEHCLVIDTQTQRRMATYDLETGERLHTQDLGECTCVYQMVYSSGGNRWKIEAFIQELPARWSHLSSTQRIQVLPNLPEGAGHDN